jgi:serine/threonine protein phosphatase 1
MGQRTIAIGDIHGCATALDGLLGAIQPAADDTLVVLGDYIDRGPESRTVVQRLIELTSGGEVAVLLGNHEEMLLLACEDEMELAGWLGYGGRETLASYGVEHPSQLPAAHLQFIRGGMDYHETAAHFFVHANYLPEVPLTRQPPWVLRWESLWQRIPPPHANGKIAVVGHTSQHEGEIWDLGHLKCIDTYCHGGGWLTALCVEDGSIWQVDRQGKPRARRGCQTREPGS